jgi:hypothetical protein
VALLEKLDGLFDLIHAVSLTSAWRCWGLMDLSRIFNRRHSSIYGSDPALSKERIDEY